MVQLHTLESTYMPHHIKYLTHTQTDTHTDTDTHTPLFSNE